MAWTPRLYTPDVSIKYYRHTGYLVSGVDGVNECLLIDPADGDVMPNCVGYTWGRWYEAFDVRPRLSTGNADGWFAYNDGYPRSLTTPTLGAIMCFSGGSYGGHVSVIEEIIDSTHVRTSNSAYNGSRFWIETVELINGVWTRPYFGYSFQGFILPSAGPLDRNILYHLMTRRKKRQTRRIICV